MNCVAGPATAIRSVPEVPGFSNVAQFKAQVDVGPAEAHTLGDATVPFIAGPKFVIQALGKKFVYAGRHTDPPFRGDFNLFGEEMEEAEGKDGSSDTEEEEGPDNND